MYLIYGVLILSAVVFFWFIALILCRRPDTGWYGTDFMQAYFWTPSAASLLWLGTLMVLKAFFKFSPSGLELIISATIFATTVVLTRFLYKRVPLVDVVITGTEANIIPFDAKDHAQKLPPDHSKRLDNDLEMAA
jgi:hypothetical protein